MKFLKFFEAFSESSIKKRYSVTFDDRYTDDVIWSLKKAGIEYKLEPVPMYFQVKKLDEIIAFAESKMEIIKAIPFYVKSLIIVRED